LDMGEPIKIYDLARHMIELSGLTIYDAATGDGDIEIQITGLRPGEKLYEELLIGNAASASPHPKIKLADEAFLPWPALDKNLKAMAICIDLQQTEKTFEIISDLVSGFCQDETNTPNSKR